MGMFQVLNHNLIPVTMLDYQTAEQGSQDLFDNLQSVQTLELQVQISKHFHNIARLIDQI